MYADIIPLIRLPRNLHTLTYRVPENMETTIRIGSLVKIPFRKRILPGIIYHIHERPNPNIQNIQSLLLDRVSEKIFLQKTQIELADWVSKTYLTSLPNTLKYFIPEIPKKRISLQSSPLHLSRHEKKISSIPNLVPLIQQVITSKHRWWYLKYHFDDQKFAFYEALFQAIMRQSGQLLIVVPLLETLHALSPLLRDFLPHIALFVGTLNTTAYVSEWSKIASGKAKIIVGTKVSLFAPFQRLSWIVVDEEHATAHKQWERNPRLHTRDTALKLADIHHAKLILGSFAPSVEAFSKISDHSYQLLYLPPSLQKNNFHIISLKDEFQKKNFTFLSDPLRDALIKTHAEKKQTLLLLNKKAESYQVLCQQCQYLFRCQACQHSYRLSGNNFQCQGCRITTPLPLVCPNCKRKNTFISQGLNIRKIKNAIKSTLVNPTILTLSADASLPQSIPPDALIIATEAAVSRFVWNNVQTIGIILSSIDQGFVHFRLEEECLQKLLKIRNKAMQESMHSPDIFVQTFAPEHPVFQAAITDKLQKFYQYELSLRKKLHYPPFARLVKLIYHHKDLSLGEHQYRFWLSRLQTLWTAKDRLTLDILPLGRQGSKIRNKYLWVILLRWKESSTPFASEPLLTLPSEWIIDVDPLDIHSSSPYATTAAQNHHPSGYKTQRHLTGSSVEPSVAL